MEQWKRVTFFLLLNVIVSACTTLGVLVLWDQFRPTLPSGAIQPITLKLSKPTATITSTTLALQAILTPTPAYLYHTVQDGDTFESIAQQYNVSVDELTLENGYTKSQLLSAGELLRVPIHLVVFSNLIGAGDLETEHLIIKSEVSGALDLTGWRLDDGAGVVYVFPSFKLLAKGQEVSLFSKEGGDTASELYWGLKAAIWLTGKTAYLRDAQGNLQATYVAP